MKKVFIIAAFAGLMSCSEDKPEVIIQGTQIDFTQDQVDSHPTDSIGKFVSDSVYLNNQVYIDSISQLESVNELLDYLETVPVQ